MVLIDVCTEMLKDGCSIDIGRLSVCRLNEYYGWHEKRVVYQVHCDHPKLKKVYSEIFDEPQEAVVEFLLLKKRLYDGRLHRSK